MPGCGAQSGASSKVDSMSKIIFRKNSRLLCFLGAVLTMLFIAAPSGVAGEKTLNDKEAMKKTAQAPQEVVSRPVPALYSASAVEAGSQYGGSSAGSPRPIAAQNHANGFVSGTKKPVPHRASLAPRVAPTYVRWGCDPFSRCGK